jgi:formate dehydrogenase gamma subunit
MDPALAVRYGLPAGIVETYLDSYHGWALQRGSDLVANCTDCHNVHDIRSELDPTSSIHPDNVTATCARCHEGANPTFARSYTHETALQARGYHEWARLIYLVLISVVLGGMVLHNMVIVRYELWRHFSKRRRTAYIVRWRWAERVQHLVLLLSFIALALTGFALRYPDCWCARLIRLSQREELRADLHRAFAVMLISAIVYHLLWLALTRRGRKSLREVAPRVSDFVQMVQNLSFYLGLRPRRPAFGGFDYTQKIEYWAVIWGTGIMAITGFVLWFPTFFTAWLPAWIVRVAEAVHFYEALLAVGAVVVWHFYYVIFTPEEYPMSTVWIDGRMPADIWRERHREQYERLGDGVLVDPAKAGEAQGDSDRSAPGQNGGASDGSRPEDADEGGRKA